MPGYSKTEAQHVILYSKDNKLPGKLLPQVDSLISVTMSSHKMPFKKKVKIVFTNSEKEQYRYNWINAPFNTHPLTGKIYVCCPQDWLSADNAMLIHCIAHELSHSLIYQNISTSKLPGYPLWFMEGLAMYSSSMVGMGNYPAYSLTEKRITNGDFIKPKDWGTLMSYKSGPTVFSYKKDDINYFAYSEFAYIVKELIEKDGSVKFYKLLHQSISDEDFYHVFYSLYGVTFDAYIEKITTHKN